MGFYYPYSKFRLDYRFILHNEIKQNVHSINMKFKLRLVRSITEIKIMSSQIY